MRLKVSDAGVITVGGWSWQNRRCSVRACLPLPAVL